MKSVPMQPMIAITHILQIRLVLVGLLIIQEPMAVGR